MDRQQEASSHGAPPPAAAVRNRSSSSSAFVSANQSPFFSPQSSGRLSLPEPASLPLPPPPPPTLCTSTTFGTPAVVYNNPSFVSASAGSSSNTQGGTSNGGGRRRKFLKSRPSSSAPSSSHRLRSYDVYVGVHGRKPPQQRFVNWLRAELELYGISCFVSDRARCRSSHSHSAVERIMDGAAYGVVVVTAASFGNPYTVEELRIFAGRRNLIPVFFDVAAADCLARDIIERRGELWEQHGGELWMLYGGIEREWREAVDALPRAADSPPLEAAGGSWRDCILRTVVLLATKLGRRGVVDRVNRWRERVEKEELPFPRNELFVGRKKELSELELILFGDVSGEGEKEYFELKPRPRRRGIAIRSGVTWKESEKEIEMQRVKKHCRKRKQPKILYGKGIACVSGESGIGKTELALEYAYRFAQRYKMILWIGGESRYLRQNYLSLRRFLDVDLGVDGGSSGCFEELEEEAVMKVRKELMRDVPFLVVVDNLDSEKDWWDQRLVGDLLPRFGGETHIIITTRLPRVMSLEPMKLSYLSSGEAMRLMRAGCAGAAVPAAEGDALKAIEERLGRLPLGLAVVGAILSELPITPSRLLDTVNRMPLQDFSGGGDQEVLTLKSNETLVKLLDVCLSIFDHADGPSSLAGRMVLVGGWFAPAAVPVQLLALAAHKARRRLLFHGSPSRLRRWWQAVTRRLTPASIRRSAAESAAMLARFGIVRSSAAADHVQFHELVRLYARMRGTPAAAHGAVQAVCLRGSISYTPDHLWAVVFLVLGVGADAAAAQVELQPAEILFFTKQMVLPLAVHIFLTYSRCCAALELLRRATDALDHAAEALLAQADKRRRRRGRAAAWWCGRAARAEQRHTFLWQEVALLKATVLETRAKLLLRGGQYDAGDDLVRKAIFIRASICGEHHPDTAAARETLGKLTRLLTGVQLS